MKIMLPAESAEPDLPDQAGYTLLPAAAAESDLQDKAGI